VRHINRLAEPPVITKLGGGWLGAFLASGNSRPSSNQYAHQEIKGFLYSMSHSKCYYCETILKDKTSEVDHQIEVSVDKNLAFTWSNLYLACDNCNSKIPQNIIKKENCLDPCINTDDEIFEDLAFDDNVIYPKNNSNRGDQTIKKYKLGSIHLDYLRSLELNKFHKVLIAIQAKAIDENRSISGDEITLLKNFANVTKPYSLMFKYILSDNGIL
jgi:uncharacterized protein (TIGR02646 family)